MASKLNSIEIKRKDKYGREHTTKYVTVNERIKAFRENKQWQGWRINTEIQTLTDNVCVMCSKIIDTEGNVIATGWARELRDDALSLVNKTSFVENCETSAVGRALGMLGIGIDDNICSAEELVYALQGKKMIEYTEQQKEARKSQEIAGKVHSYDQLTEREKEEYDGVCVQCDFAQDRATLGRIYNIYRDASFEPLLADKCKEICIQNKWETK